MINIRRSIVIRCYLIAEKDESVLKNESEIKTEQADGEEVCFFNTKIL